MITSQQIVTVELLSFIALGISALLVIGLGINFIREYILYKEWKKTPEHN